MSALRVAIVGCGLIGAKRAAALTQADELVGCYDVRPAVAQELAERHGSTACATLEELFERAPDVVLVAAVHDRLAELTEQALRAGAHVLVEKPAGVGSAELRRLIALQQASGLLVKVGFNHRFHPAIARVAAEVHSGEHGELLHLRGLYGHGGRPGYEREWRAQPARSGGGELIDQGMHLLDISNWIAGPLPLHCALLRTQFWDTPVEDNAALLLGERETRSAPWALLHVSWTEWKNRFSLEVYCARAKLHVEGLVRSYGTQRLRIYRMDDSLGPPALEEIVYPAQDVSWQREWEHFRAAVLERDRAGLRERDAAGLPERDAAGL
ncbi:MAG TPA: Gfo/Idh/MocA family oxidoreductase, partial [Solirubrobacteraceae bacterium]|nr:Gfo/Idh/MocA family oxidoreductase [Solirubrobacteraceae bacterium]